MTDTGKWSVTQLDYTFGDPALLERALTHRSASSRHNERLEFLGDALLGLVIATALYEAKPQTREGSLSRYRSLLVRSETLTRVGRELGLPGVMRLGSSELQAGGHLRPSVLANAVEAVFGAVYLDGGFATADRVIRQVFAERLANLPGEEALKDAKTRLQEWLQARQMPPPDYDLLDVSGEDHRQVFRIACRVPTLHKETGGTGSSRRRAEQAAAEAMLDNLSDDA